MADFCTIGDLHLDALVKYWGNANALQLQCVDQVIDSVYRNGIKHILFLGDIAQGIRDTTGNKVRLSEDAQVQLLRLIDKWDGKVTLDFILGNHDLAEIGSHSLQLFMTMQELGMFKTTRFHEKPSNIVRSGVRISLMPFPHKTPSDASFALGHYEVKGALGDTGYKCGGELHEYKIPVVQGHLHTRQRVRNHYYPGTLYQMSFGEKLPKGYGVVRATKETFAYRWVEKLPPFELRNVYIEKPKDFERLTPDATILQKLFVSDTVRLPSNLLSQYPNIVNALVYGDEKELQAIQDAELALETESSELNHEEFLPAVLSSIGASVPQINRAVKLMHSLRGN